MLSLTQGALGLASGSLVGFSLGLVGGGGSILAVPLLIYLVGVSDPHVAIGTSAIAVAANAAANLVNHARAGNVKWRCAFAFSLAGVAGAFLGSTLGKIVEGQKLLALFAVVMMIVGALMLKGRSGVASRRYGSTGRTCRSSSPLGSLREPCPASSVSAAVF